MTIAEKERRIDPDSRQGGYSNSPSERKSLLRAGLSRFSRSTALLTVLFLVIADLAITALNPLQLLNTTGLTGLNHYYVVSKLPLFFSTNENPDIVLTGASAFLHAAVRADDKLEGKQTRYDKTYIRDHVDTYTQASYLEKKLSRKSGKKVSVINLSTAGGLMSDQYWVLKRCVDSGRHPKLAIADISPREFHDNNQKDLFKTPVYLVLKDLSSLGETLRSSGDPKLCAERLLECFWTTFRGRRDFREFIVNATASATGHPADMFHAVSKQPEKNVSGNAKKAENHSSIDGEEQLFHPQDILERDLNAYRKMYTPVDDKMLEEQIAYLGKYLDLARANGIEVILLSMPLRAENTKLVPATIERRLNSKLQTASKLPGVQLVEADKKTDFVEADFEDSAHLDTTGAVKLFDLMSDPIETSLR